jgi:hypothetical protein
VASAGGAGSGDARAGARANCPQGWALRMRAWSRWGAHEIGEDVRQLDRDDSDLNREEDGGDEHEHVRVFKREVRLLVEADELEEDGRGEGHEAQNGKLTHHLPHQ